ncbi:MAG TPA: response regulator transcription factor, partial [Gaiellaceae bacterium]|nr:response regulator transcription factor [Gaiellaceae bacterium]
LLTDCAVIVLGSADTKTRLRALERCDDYLSRPFSYEELVARIRAVLRRRQPRTELLHLGELVIDRAARRVTARGVDVALSAKEYALLLKLASDPERVFTREQLLRDVWGYRSYIATRTLESHASRVRCKLAAAGLPGWVVNVWGVGYKLRPSA